MLQQQFEKGVPIALRAEPIDTRFPRNSYPETPRRTIRQRRMDEESTQDRERLEGDGVRGRAQLGWKCPTEKRFATFEERVTAAELPLTTVWNHSPLPLTTVRNRSPIRFPEESSSGQEGPSNQLPASKGALRRRIDLEDLHGCDCGDQEEDEDDLLEGEAYGEQELMEEEEVDRQPQPRGDVVTPGEQGQPQPWEDEPYDPAEDVEDLVETVDETVTDDDVNDK